MARRLGLATALTVLLTCMVGGASPAAAAKKKKRACAAVSAIPKETTLPRAYDAVLCLVNQERARRGLRALRRSEQLTRAAVDHSSDMVSRQYFAHANLEGETARERVLRTGYFRGSASGMVLEVLACGWAHRATPRALVTGLMRSPTHQSVLLNGRLRDVGIGLVLGGPQRVPGFSGATLTLDVGRR